MTSDPPRAFVFDAYGRCSTCTPSQWSPANWRRAAGDELSRAWRAKQLEYTWLSSLMQSGTTGRGATSTISPRRALDHATAALGIKLGRDAKRRLCAAYLALAPYPTRAERWPRWSRDRDGSCPTERRRAWNACSSKRPCVAVGRRVVGRRRRTSTSRHRAVYAMAEQRLGLPARRIAFISSNCWDAIGAQSYGFTTFWINRSGAPVDRHGTRTASHPAIPGELPRW
jgi:2-haloacid dehalogenase